MKRQRLNVMVFFKNANFLKTFEDNMRAAAAATARGFPGLARKGPAGNRIKVTDKPPEKINPISLGRLIDAPFMIKSDCYESTTTDAIVFKTNVKFGGLREDKISFVNEKDEEVAFFSVSEVKEIIRVYKEK